MLWLEQGSRRSCTDEIVDMRVARQRSQIFWKYVKIKTIGTGMPSN
jgi:hypothetical protein